MFYYDIKPAAQTTNATPATENQAARLLTIANQGTAAIMGFYASGQMAAAGGLVIQCKTAATPGTSGSAYTPAPRHPRNPAAEITAFTAHTVGTTLTTRQMTGSSAQGGFGGWFAATLEQAITLRPNGGANGNAEFTNLSGLASTVHHLAIEVVEL